MVISPILIIIVSAILIATITLYIINRPKMPLFTCVFLILLLFSVIFTFAVNIDLSSNNSIVNSTGSFIRFITSFVTMSETPSKQILLKSFNLFCKIDISLIVISVLVFIMEIRLLFKNTSVPRKGEVR